MATAIFRVTQDNTLRPLYRKTMSEVGRTEPQQLETWMTSGGDGLFGKKVLWIGRSDRPAQDPRSDVLGIDEEGDMVLAEVKTGEVYEDSVTRLLGLAAEYAPKTAEALAALFCEQAGKPDSLRLAARPGSPEEALQVLKGHAGEETELNLIQRLILVGEQFADQTLAIGNYLNNFSGDACYAVECWRYSVQEDEGGALYFALERILPPPDCP